MIQSKTLIFIPTYNEAGNVERIFQQIQALNLNADVLFLDDNSPDGTGKIIDTLVSGNNNVYVIHRKGKLGIGSAHKAGIQKAYENGYEALITMDCDFTHTPDYILDFIRHKDATDVVVGSRFLQKGSLSAWSLFRKVITHFGHFLTVTLLNMPYDASGAFRLYNLKNIDKRFFSLVLSNGYAFFFESLFVLNFNRINIFEIPIELPPRAHGSSKMTLKDACTGFSFLFSLYLRKVFNIKTLRIKH